MKQSIYELDKARTPGPIGCRYKSAAKIREKSTVEMGYPNDGGGSIGHILCGPDKPYGREVLAHMRINRIPANDPRHLADVAYLAHCANHFMRAVKAFRRLRETISDDNLRTEIDKLLEDLETVEVPE